VSGWAWAGTGLGGWLILAAALAVVIGRGIRLADTRECWCHTGIDDEAEVAA
jgi:hypothetical protein